MTRRAARAGRRRTVARVSTDVGTAQVSSRDEPGGYDVARVRAAYPALAAGAAHFDGPGGSQTPLVVAQAVLDTMVSPISNRGTVTAAEQKAEEVVQAGRLAMADLLGADPRGVVFGRSMTQLTFDVARTLARGWSAGDEVVVSRLDHDANVRPWVIAAERAGATVRWADLDPSTAELTVEHVAAVLSDRTRLVALTGASNLVGTRPDVPTIAAQVHRTGALLYVDGVHLTAHAPVDVGELGADFYACSPYKFSGPHCGVLAADPALLEGLHPDKLLPSTDAVPERFELGTLPYELIAGTTAAVDFLAGLTGGPGDDRRGAVLRSMAAVEAHEERLRCLLEERLAQLPEVVLHSRAARRTPTLLLTLTGRSAADASQFLAAHGVNAPAGTFYAHEPAQRLGLQAGGLRAGLALYSDESDVERLVDGIRAFLAG